MSAAKMIAIQELEAARKAALSGDALAMLRFARLVLACWPTIIKSLCGSRKNSPWR